MAGSMKKQNNSLDFGLTDFVQQKTNMVVSSATYTHRLYGIIGEPEEHIDLIETLDQCGENDIVYVYINTLGGSLDGCISIIHAFRRSKGTIVTVADGSVASAGTMIFLASKNKIVFPYSYFMFHDASGGTGTKINEVLKDAKATSRLIKQMCLDLYYPYFTKREIESILEGKDYHLSAHEMVERIEKVESKKSK